MHDWLGAKNTKDALESKGRFDRAYTNVFNTYPGGVPPQVVPANMVDAQSSMPMPPGPELEPKNEVKPADQELKPKNEVKTKTTYTEAEAPELSNGLTQRLSTYKTVKKTGENCRIVRPLKDIDLPAWADAKYDAIRSCTDDISKIARFC